MRTIYAGETYVKTSKDVGGDVEKQTAARIDIYEKIGNMDYKE